MWNIQSTIWLLHEHTVNAQAHVAYGCRRHTSQLFQGLCKLIVIEVDSITVSKFLDGSVFHDIFEHVILLAVPIKYFLLLFCQFGLLFQLILQGMSNIACMKSK
jgi:hypothetical protein